MSLRKVISIIFIKVFFAKTPTLEVYLIILSFPIKTKTPKTSPTDIPGVFKTQIFSASLREQNFRALCTSALLRESQSYIIPTERFTNSVRSLPVSKPCARSAKSKDCFANLVCSSSLSALRILSMTLWFPLMATL